MTMRCRTELNGGNTGARRSDRSCGRRRRFERGPALVAALLLTVSAQAVPALAEPHVPTDDSQVIERLPTAGNKTARELRQLQADLKQSPQNLALALRVAARDIELARAESDPRYNGYAEAALAHWIDLPEPPKDVLVMRATLRQSRHDFVPALGDLDRVIALDPDDAQAWLTRAVILQVQGDYAQALDNCRAVRRLTEPLGAEICSDGVEALNGHAREGYRALQVALDGARPGESGQLRLWALTVLAETAARLGDSAAAQRYFDQAMSLGIGDGYLLGAYADFLLDEQRPNDVRPLLGDKTRIDPLLLRLALAESDLDEPTVAQHRTDLAERFAAARQRGDAVHLREEARFALHLLHQPRAALEIAKANWAVQREPWDARLVLEAALAAGEPDAARPVLDWLATTRMEDVHLSRLVEQLKSEVR